MNSNELLAGMRAIPAADRPKTDVRFALRAMLIKKYPCGA
jgi:hypothetical protein